VTDNLLEDVTALIREHYCFCRKRAQRIEVFRPGERWDKFFKRAAWHCVEHKIPPQEYIEVQFHAMKPYPEISQIGSERALKRYREARCDYITYVNDDARLQAIGFNRLVSVGNDPKDVLLDSSNGFDALFIYLAACAYGLEDIKRNTLDAARLKYMTSVYYDNIYDGVIPDELKKPLEEC